MRLICGALACLELARAGWRRSRRPALAASPDIATAGKAAAATTTPASRPQISSEVALAKML
jgi:hypothetical protein